MFSLLVLSFHFISQNTRKKHSRISWTKNDEEQQQRKIGQKMDNNLLFGSATNANAMLLCAMGSISLVWQNLARINALTEKCMKKKTMKSRWEILFISNIFVIFPFFCCPFRSLLTHQQTIVTWNHNPSGFTFSKTKQKGCRQPIPLIMNTTESVHRAVGFWAFLDLNVFTKLVKSFSKYC